MYHCNHCGKDFDDPDKDVIIPSYHYDEDGGDGKSLDRCPYCLSYCIEEVD